jgi:hypothetical protein
VKKYTVRDLKRVIKESLENPRVISEISEYEKEKEDSLDIQVDRFLSQYESNANKSKNENFDFRSFTKMLLEKEDEKDSEEDSKEDEIGSELKKLSLDDISVETFASDVARLVDNYNNLLEIKTTIIKRAKNFLLKNYQVEVAKQFVEVLNDTFDISIERSNKIAPAQARAGGSDEAGGGFSGGSE